MSTTQASNGYMIRLEVLKMAKEMAEQDYFSQRDAIRQQWEVEASFAQGKGSDVAPTMPTFPTFPSPEAIKLKANELYSFITTK
jgi:hypothetical protein